MRRGIIGGGAAVIFAALIGAAQAQGTDSYPDRPIKVVVPAAAGGVTDTPARVVTNRMRDNLGRPSSLESGRRRWNSGVRERQAGTPDGYTLLYVNAATHGLLPALKKSLPYNALKDFVPIAMVVWAPLAIVVRSESPYKTLADLVKGANDPSKPLNYGSPAPATHRIDRPHALAGQQDPMQAVHYRGEADNSGSDFRSGGFRRLEHHPQPCRGGHVRVLATTGEKRWFAFPDAPTLRELGYTVEYYAWSGFVAPAGTPRQSSIASTSQRISRSGSRM